MLRKSENLEKETSKASDDGVMLKGQNRLEARTYLDHHCFTVLKLKTLRPFLSHP